MAAVSSNRRIARRVLVVVMSTLVVVPLLLLVVGTKPDKAAIEAGLVRLGREVNMGLGNTVVHSLLHTYYRQGVIRRVAVGVVNGFIIAVVVVVFVVSLSLSLSLLLLLLLLQGYLISSRKADL